MGGLFSDGMNDDLSEERWSNALEIVLITVGLSDGRMLFARRTLSPGPIDVSDGVSFSVSALALLLLLALGLLSDCGDADEDDDNS